MPQAIIRPSTALDVPAITRIYNHAILYGTATFETDPLPEAVLAGRRQEKLDEGYPFVVAEVDGQVAGYAYAGPFRPRAAYRFTVEDSIYLDPMFQRQGLGRKLLSTLIDGCRARDYRQMVAVIGDSGNAGSIELHRALGFRHIGTMENTGYKFDRFIDTVIMQLTL